MLATILGYITAFVKKASDIRERTLNTTCEIQHMQYGFPASEANEQNKFTYAEHTLTQQKSKNIIRQKAHVLRVPKLVRFL